MKKLSSLLVLALLFFSASYAQAQSQKQAQQAPAQNQGTAAAPAPVVICIVTLAIDQSQFGPHDDLSGIQPIPDYQVVDHAQYEGSSENEIIDRVSKMTFPNGEKPIRFEFPFEPHPAAADES